MAVTFRLALGQSASEVALSAGSDIPGGNAVQVNFDHGRMSRFKAILLLRNIQRAIMRGKWPPATPAPDPDPGGDLVNDTPPSFIQPDGSGGWEPADPSDDNENVFLDAGEWSGGVPPYSYEYEIREVGTDNVLAARDSGTEVDMGDLSGLTVYGRVWCIDDEANEEYADTLPFGPVAGADFVEKFVVNMAFCEDPAYEIDDEVRVYPGHVAVVCKADKPGGFGGHSTAPQIQPYPDMEPVSVDGTEYGLCGGGIALFSDNRHNGRTGASAMLSGRGNLSSSSSYYTCAMPNGWYRARVIFGNPGSSSAALSGVELVDGAANAGDVLFSLTNSEAGHTASEIAVTGEDDGDTIISVISKTDVKNWLADTDPKKGVWSAKFEVTKGAVRLQGPEAGSGSPIVCIAIKTVAPPTGG